MNLQFGVCILAPPLLMCNSNHTNVPDTLAHSHSGSLRGKLVLSLVAMFLLLLVIDEAVREQVIKPAFSSLERHRTMLDSNRVLAALDTEIQHLRELANQQARHLCETKARGIETSPWPASVPERGAIWTALIDVNGESRWLGQPDDREPPSPQTPSAVDASHLWQSILRSRDVSPSITTGMTCLGNHRLFLFAIAELNTTELNTTTYNETALALADRPTHLVMAREFDKHLAAQLRRQTLVDFVLKTDDQKPANHSLKVGEVAHSLSVEVHLMDPFDNPLATLLVQQPRELVGQVNEASVLARRSFMLGASAALLLMLLLLQRIVIGPLMTIREYFEQVAAEGLQATSLTISQNDEIGQLAQALQQTMHRLSVTQTRLTKASRAAGRCQVADAVIHNVGNVLTNVNSLLESATDRVTKFHVEPLDKLANRLEAEEFDDALRQAMPGYLHRLADSLSHDQRELSDVLGTLNDNMRHIHDVIRDQRRYATVPITRDFIAIKDLIQQAIHCCQARLDQDHVSVSMAEPINALIESDHSMLLQVLINLISNAHEAMRESTATRLTLAISVDQQPDVVQLRFHDNGCGMSATTLDNIFDAHFTTRDGGSGLGLHFCAITLKRLGGSIHAESPGPGHGATFVIELPCTGWGELSSRDRVSSPTLTPSSSSSL